jgi:hypothetical protein
VRHKKEQANREEDFMNKIILQDRLKAIEELSLKSGKHEAFEAGMCVMEAVSYIAGESWSDAPQCACPVITAFMVSWNDSLPKDADRDRILKPLIPLIVGTRSSKFIEQRRATMAADWFIRVHTPAFLRIAKLEKQACLMEALPEITDFAQCPSLMPTLNAVRSDAAAARDAAWAAAWAAARDAALAADLAAAWAAAWAAARDAALAAALAAAWAAARDAALAAAWDAALAAARDAAWAAARDAALAAAWDCFKHTVDHLQESAVELLKRMAALKDDSEL